MEKIKVSKEIINIYRNILLDKLQQCDEWYINSDGSLRCNPINKLNNIFFSITKNINGNSKIEIKYNNSTKFTFNVNYFDFKLKSKIYDCKEYLKNKEKIQEIKSIEKFLINSLDDLYKRKLKIEKIKKKI